MDYASPDRRKSKNDKKAKARFNRFKQGGAQRARQFNRSSSASGQES